MAGDWERAVWACELLLWAVRFALGTCLFSFLNVVIYRVPRGESVVWGRSHCTACGHELSAGELVPLFSYLILRGRCKACGAKISPRYFIVECLGGAAFVLCGGFFGTGKTGLLSGRGAVMFAFLAILVAVAAIDADTRTIPDRFPLLAFALGFPAIFLFPEIGVWERLIGAAVISVPMLLLALWIPGAFGGGDIKLMAAGGWLLGWRAVVFAMFVALLLGGAYCAAMLSRKKLGRKEQIAFGPFLAAGLGAAAFFGERAMGWYLGLLG